MMNVDGNRNIVVHDDQRRSQEPESQLTTAAAGVAWRIRRSASEEHRDDARNPKLY